MTKIVFVNRYFYPDHSATSQMLSDLVFALADAEVSIVVVTSRQSYDDADARQPPKELIEGVNVLRIWTTSFGRMNLLGRSLDYISFYISAFWTLLTIVERGDVIVAKTDPPLISVVAWVVARVKKAHLINWLQDVFPEVAIELGLLRSNALAWAIKKIRNLSLRAAAMNIVLGERMRDRMIREGVDRSRIRIIHNWADSDLVKPVSRGNNELRQEWGMQDKFVVGYSGNLGRAHDLETIIDAMQRVDMDPDIVFLFIGGGAGRSYLENAVLQRGLKNCEFKSYQPRGRLSESLSVPDVHLVSLKASLEGLIVPSKIYGIAAAGRPVVFIGDPCGEIPLIIERCDFGMSVPVGNGEELGRVLSELKTNADLIVSMGINARRCLLECYDKHHAVREWREVLLKEAGFSS